MYQCPVCSRMFHRPPSKITVDTPTCSLKCLGVRNAKQRVHHDGFIDVGKPRLVKVSPEDEFFLRSLLWSLDGKGYACRSEGYGSNRHRVAMHRVILARKLGRKLRDDEYVDHINRDPMDNRRDNLRVCTWAENVRNRNRQRNCNGYIGVHETRTRKGVPVWRAYIGFEHTQIAIGRFYDPLEAAWIRDQYALELFGEFAKTNFEYVEIRV